MRQGSPDDLLTVPETATLSRLKVSTIRKWILERKIGYVKLGRRVFVRREDLDSMIAESFIPAEPQAKNRPQQVGVPLLANQGRGPSPPAPCPKQVLPGNG